MRFAVKDRIIKEKPFSGKGPGKNNNLQNLYYLCFLCAWRPQKISIKVLHLRHILKVQHFYVRDNNLFGEKSLLIGERLSSKQQ